MLNKKGFFRYFLLIFFAVLTGYTFLIRASFYNDEGEGVRPGVRIISEKLAGDYALFRLLEQGVSPREAYQPENISSFLHKTLHIKGDFFSYASAVKSFLVVPSLQNPYLIFSEVWFFWGLFLFGAALYTFLPLKMALLLMFALPAPFLCFATGGWGLLMAAGIILALTLPEGYPKAAGFFGALCLIEPLSFFAVLAVFLIRRQKKTALVCSAVAGILLFFSLQRYGITAFTEAFKAAFAHLKNYPADMMSLTSLLYRSGLPLFFALTVQMAVAGIIIYFSYALLLKSSCPQAVQDAYLCAALCLISPFASLGDYGLLYAGAAFLIRDMDARGALKGDHAFLLLAFSSIYLELFCVSLTGASIHFWLAVGLLLISYRRSY